MSFSATRLTCYALLAAVEQDMRDAIDTCLGEESISIVLPEDRLERAQVRRGKDGLPPATALPALLPYLDFGDAFELLASNYGSLQPDLRTSLQQMAPNVGRVIAIRNRVAHTRPMEIDDSAHLLDVSHQLLKYARAHWPTLQATIDRLGTNPSYVLGLTINLATDPDRAPQHNLPIPDFDETGFFGRKEELRRIKKAIKGAYPVVSILGDGGIGKTAIALKVAYELLEDSTQVFDAFVWVTAKATVLTPNEIKRINGAIESSLGLFARAADELGGAEVDNPIAEVLSYMENFKVLLILDNLETVLDARLREFLLDLPVGSKVIITSRIGLGIENPVQLAPLSDDDSGRLLRTLARIRSVPVLQELPQPDVEQLARRMAGHPAYIKWFVAGIQAGRRPEELVGNNELLLEFCMSNVYEYLTDDARAAVRSMQVLPGARNQGELAFLNDFSAATTQATLLELLTTNFVQMSSQSFGQSLDTVYQLSEFGKQYLDKHHAVAPEERDWLLNRSQELRDLGFQMTVESTSSPYSADTVYVRGPGDVHGAKILRDAMELSRIDPSGALARCQEVQVLAPAYYEAWRVEAHVRAISRDQAGAVAAFDRAIELAPESPVVCYHYGSFLLNDAGDPRGALRLLQAGARYDRDSPELAGQISWAHFCLGDPQAALAAAAHIMQMPQSSPWERKAACLIGLRAAIVGVSSGVGLESGEAAAELLEAAVELVERVNLQHLRGESLDRILQLRDHARAIADSSEGYLATKAAEWDSRLTTIQQAVDGDSQQRRVGRIKTLIADKGYGFLSDGRMDYFVHFRDFQQRHDFEQLAEGSTCAFNPNPKHPRGPRAEQVRLLE